MNVDTEANFANVETRAREPISTLLCISAYNQEKEIGPLIIKAKQYFDQILVCDDGSQDVMGPIAEGLGATVILHETSIGRIATLRNLLERSLEIAPEITLVIDVDPRFKPSEIPKLLSPIKSKEADVVFGVLQTNGADRLETNHGDLKRIFMAFSQKSLKAFLSPPSDVLESHTRILEVAKNYSLNFREVPIEMQELPNVSELETQARETSPPHTEITQQSNTPEMPKDKGIAQSFIRHISTKPYYFFGIPGLVALGIGIFFGVYLFDVYLTRQLIDLPYAFIMVVGVISGLFLLTTSIILEAFSYLIKNR